MKEYREINKDKIKEQEKEYRERNKERKKEYREQNKEKINEQRSTKCLCACGGTYTLNNKSTHEKTTKHQNWLKENS